MTGMAMWESHDWKVPSVTPRERHRRLSWFHVQGFSHRRASGMNAPANRDDLVQVVALAGGLAPDRAAAVVEAMVRFLGSRLPSPLFGQLQDRLQASGLPPQGLPTTGTGPSL